MYLNPTTKLSLFDCYIGGGVNMLKKFETRIYTQLLGVKGSTFSSPIYTEKI